MSEQQNTAVAPAAPPETGLAQRGPTAVVPTSDLPEWFAGSSMAGVLTSLDLTDPHDEYLFVTARQQKCTPLTEIVNTTIEVSDYIAHPVTVVEDNGQLVELVRIVLIGPDGKMFQAASEGVRMSLMLIFQCRGRGPWEPALRLTPKLTKTRRGYNVLQLLLEKPAALAQPVAPPRPRGRKVFVQPPDGPPLPAGEVP